MLRILVTQKADERGEESFPSSLRRGDLAYRMKITFGRKQGLSVDLLQADEHGVRVSILDEPLDKVSME